MKDSIVPPRFPRVVQFDPDRFTTLYNDFQRRLGLFLDELRSTGPCTVQTLDIVNPPTAATGQRDGKVYVEDGYLKLAGQSQASFRKAGTDTITDTNTTVAVAFNTAMPDTNYAISIVTDGNEFVWVTSKATTGFTLNRSASSGNRVVDWTVIPYSDI